MSAVSNPNLNIDCTGGVATIRNRARGDMSAAEQEEAARSPTGMLALANALDELRAEESIRVSVLVRGGDNITTARYTSEAFQKHHNDPTNIWRTFSGIVRFHEVVAAIEKPVIAQVVADVSGATCNQVLACDLIVADEAATFIDHHMSSGEVANFGAPFSLVPGDGGVSLVPLYMSPPLAKEFLMLPRGFTARELADRGLINYAVPASSVQAKVDELVHRLLMRPAYPLAWAKRVANRLVVDQLNRTLDAGAGYEMIGLSQLERQGWEDKLTFG
jgi:2-(1,2-epoxy-1,2-dihydrophenyl)acetyl-CoA isomerase